MKYTGLNGFVECDITESGSFTAFDKVEDFELSVDGNDYNENLGIGGQTAAWYSMGYPVGSASTMLQTDSLFASNLLIRSAIGSKPTVIEQIQGGISDQTNGSVLHYDCYLNSVEFSCEVDGVVMVSYEWFSLDYEYQTIASGSVATHSTISPFTWHSGDVQIDSTNYSCQSWTVTIENNLRAETSLDTKPDGSQRLPESIEVGNYKVSLSAEFQEQPGYFDYGLDNLIDETITFYANADNNEDTPQTFTIDGTGGNGFHITSQPVSVSGAGDETITHSLECESETNDLSILSLDIS